MWSRKNIFEILPVPCAKPFSDLLINFINGRIFALNYKFSNKNVCARLDFKKKNKLVHIHMINETLS